MGFTVSVSQGRIAREHDMRLGKTPKNVDATLSHNNVTVISSAKYKDEFNDFFKQSIDDYNSKQSRKDRLLSYDYFEKLKSSKNDEKPFYEYVVQIGNRDTNSVLATDEESMKARQALDTVCSNLQNLYPSFKFWFIGSHGDEPNGTYHYHICFTPIGTNYKTGMPVRCSMKQALKQMGFTTKGHDYAISQWKRNLENHLEDAMLELGLEREVKDEKRAHLETDEYKRAQQNAETEKNLKASRQLFQHAEQTDAKAQENFDDSVKDIKISSSHRKAAAQKSKELDEREEELDKLQKEHELKVKADLESIRQRTLLLDEREKELDEREAEPPIPVEREVYEWAFKERVDIINDKKIKFRPIEMYNRDKSHSKSYAQLESNAQAIKSNQHQTTSHQFGD